MGANAQTTVPTFVASQVLTADQQNQSARTGVPVFASTGDRDAAFGGTGEKTLAEGQLCYVEGTGLQTYNAGGSWVTWGATGSGLVRITTVSFTTSAAVAFAAGVFSATYDNYRVIFEFVPSANCTLACQVNASGTVQTTNNYFGNRYDLRAGAVVGSNPGTSHAIMGANGATPAHNAFCIDVIKPADAAVRTSWHGTFYGANAAGTFDGGVTSAEYNVAAAHDGLTLTPSTGTITGKYSVYGYN